MSLIHLFQGVFPARRRRFCVVIAVMVFAVCGVRLAVYFGVLALRRCPFYHVVPRVRSWTIAGGWTVTESAVNDTVRNMTALLAQVGADRLAEEQARAAGVREGGLLPRHEDCDFACRA
jgi:hypothetical protein